MKQNIRESKNKLTFLDVMITSRRRHSRRATPDYHLFAMTSRSFFHNNRRSKIGMVRPLWRWWCGHGSIDPGGCGGGAAGCGSSGVLARRVFRLWDP